MARTKSAPAALRSLGSAHGVTSCAHPPWVLFANDLWGYGSVTTAMAIADELEGKATRLFAGSGPGFELARRSGFDRLLRTDTMATRIPPDLARAMMDCRAVVSVMNPRVARWAVQRRIPCVYVDSLLWMWAQPPAVPTTVPYCQERFPGAEERLEGWRGRFFDPEVVGPLVTRPDRARSQHPDAVLINFGGLSCSLLDVDTLVAYADAMAQCTIAALDGRGERVVISVGDHVRRRMDHRRLEAMRPGVELHDLSHDTYLAELRRSRLLITSAGMHALYEAATLGVPFVCLPAQNLSNALALDVLAREDADRPVRWRDLYGPMDLDADDEAETCRVIGERIRRFAGDEEARGRLVRHLRTSMDGRRLGAARRRQARFLEAQGELGAPRVAERILGVLNVPANCSAS